MVVQQGVIGSVSSEIAQLLVLLLLGREQPPLIFLLYHLNLAVCQQCRFVG